MIKKTKHVMTNLIQTYGQLIWSSAIQQKKKNKQINK